MDEQYSMEMLSYSIDSIIHFYHLTSNEVWDLTYSRLWIMMKNIVRYRYPETLPKPKKKIKNKEDLYEHLKAKYWLS